MQQKVKKSKFFWLSLFTTVALFIVNSTGFVDTMTGSTEGCGKHWPLCNGSIFPSLLDIHELIEFGHRLLVFIAMVFLIVNSVSAWRKYGSNRKVKAMIFLAIAGVVVESFLGAMSVFFVNPPLVMASHMGIALISFAAMLILTITIHQIDNPATLPRVQANKTYARATWFTFFYLFLAIYFGAFVASAGAGGFFKGFPIPTETFAQAHAALLIDIAHRTIALGLLLLTIVLTVLAKRTRQARYDLFVGSVASLILVCLQGVSGAIMIYTHLSMASILLHVTIVSLLFGDLAFLSIQCMFKTVEKTTKNENSSTPDKLGKRSKIDYA